MKKRQYHKLWFISLLFLLFFSIEMLWLNYVYRVEENDFRNIVNQFIENAIQETSYSFRHRYKEHNGITDYRHPKRITMTYCVKDRPFRIDTVKSLVDILRCRKFYDFHHREWCLDSLHRHFLYFCPWPDLNLTFVRRDSSGNLIDRFPAVGKLPREEADLKEWQLGNLEPDKLSAWFDFPFAHFWIRQRYGLLLSILPLLLALYYCIQIFRQERSKYRNRLMTEKQTIFIHDLKTPLCTNRHIDKRILQLAHQWPPEKIQEKLRLSHHQIDEIKHEMTELVFRSAEEWGVKIENEPCNLQILLEELTERYQLRFKEAKIRLEFHLENPTIQGDAFHLTHIMRNLLDNAIRHAGDNAEITIKCFSDQKGQLCLSLKDNGPGIPSRLKRKIFHAGFSTQKKHNHHGIGLAYIQKIIQCYGGTIHINTPPSNGTEFHLTFMPKKTIRRKFFSASPSLYRNFLIATISANLLWTINLCIAERTAFATEEMPLLDEAIFQCLQNSFKIRVDTNFFVNNYEEQTITIMREGKDTTIAMGNFIHSSQKYGRMSYDFRDTNWMIDSIMPYYRRYSRNRLPVIFSRTDGNQKTIDRFPASTLDFFLPIKLTLPLGYVERHQLEATLAYPWTTFLKKHHGWFIISLLFTLLSGWLCFRLFQLAKHQHAFIHFQQEEVQHFIRHLQPWLNRISYPENEPVGKLIIPLQQNIRIYETMIEQINQLLQKIHEIQQTIFQ